MSSHLANTFMFLVGFASQVLFFGRVIIQWIKSEKAGKVLSPVIFWQISLIASILMLVYGILRKDFAIILGQLIVYFIYIRNLQLQGEWEKINRFFRFAAWLMPFGCVGWMLLSGNYSFNEIVKNEKIAHWLMVWGIVAQLVFTFRFIYQWLFSEKNKESSLPVGFWYISIAGSSMILFYAILRLDPVLFLGQLGGMIMYVRNLFLHYTQKGIFDLLPFDMAGVKKFLIKKEKKG